MINEEDYSEPRCPLCIDGYKKDAPSSRIPVARVIAKADEYFSRNDYAGAERHFLYWIDEAKAGGDKSGEFAVYNELMGLYRKTARRDDALKSAEETMRLIGEMGIENEIAAGTAYVNAGTVYKTFELYEKAYELFKKAERIYIPALGKSDGRLGAMYNNMALVAVDLKKYGEAREMYKSALEIMRGAENGELEMAITYLNMVDLVAKEKGLLDGAEEVATYFLFAQKLLDTKSVPRDGYYAFVCEKCADTFGYYGYFDYQADLLKRAKDIYERS